MTLVPSFSDVTYMSQTSPAYVASGNEALKDAAVRAAYLGRVTAKPSRR
jgi:hypothetical protein